MKNKRSNLFKQDLNFFYFKATIAIFQLNLLLCDYVNDQNELCMTQHRKRNKHQLLLSLIKISRDAK